MYEYARRISRGWRVTKVTDDGTTFTSNTLCKPQALAVVLDDTKTVHESTTWTRRDCMAILMPYNEGDTFNVYDLARSACVTVAYAQAVCCVAARYGILAAHGGRFAMAI